MLKRFEESLLPLIATFTLSCGLVVYLFFQTGAYFFSSDESAIRPLPGPRLIAVRSKKFLGYSIRLLAVLIWGLVPIYVRYTPVNTLSPFLRTFLLGIGVVLPSALIYCLWSLIRNRRLPRWHLPYDNAFLILVIGQVGYMCLQNASLIYTSGTNFLLFNSFAPLMGLIIAAVFWHREIAYFKRPGTMFWIFIFALMASIGSVMLVSAHSVIGNEWSVVGDILAMISTFFDVLLTVGQIQYIKRFTRTEGLLLNIHIFFFVMLSMAPLILLAPLVGGSLLKNLSYPTLFLGLGTGLFIGFGQLLNYEAFKRIEGYLAYLMFNLSVLVTFVLETFVLHSVRPTILFLFSGLMIIGASVFAEIVNSRCEKKGF
jgi:drug/metabolite transporter (DMT)-like permease